MVNLYNNLPQNTDRKKDRDPLSSDRLSLCCLPSDNLRLGCLPGPQLRETGATRDGGGNRRSYLGYIGTAVLVLHAITPKVLDCQVEILSCFHYVSEFPVRFPKNVCGSDVLGVERFA